MSETANGGRDSLGDVRVEVVPDPAYAGDLGTADLLERFRDRADELGAAIGGIGSRLQAAMERRISHDPSDAWNLGQVTVEIAVNLEAETGIVICKGKTAAAFKVNLVWTRREPGPAR